MRLSREVMAQRVYLVVEARGVAQQEVMAVLVEQEAVAKEEILQAAKLELMEL